MPPPSATSPSPAIPGPARRSSPARCSSTAGAVNRLGKVDEGTTVTDYDEEAIARKHTLGSSLAWLEWQKTKMNLIDSPGVGNLLTDTRGAMRVVEAVVVVVNAVAGVQVQTEAVWQLAVDAGLPRLIVSPARP